MRKNGQIYIKMQLVKHVLLQLPALQFLSTYRMASELLVTVGRLKIY